MHAGSALCLSLLLGASMAAPSPASADQITSLPGFGPPPSSHFSGFLSVGTKNLHYYFVESERSPAADPVVLWLNGGPGCSSLDGLFYEQGPLLVTPDGQQLVRNNNSWATVANMLYLEAPCGVGFSYSHQPADYSNDDVGTAKDNLAALEAFFQRFPQFKANQFYVSGESYAGVYVPTLSQQIFESAATNRINMKGFLVGNGCFDSKIQAASDIGYLWGHGLIPNALFSNITASCTDPSHASTACQQLKEQAERLTAGVNIYSTYGDCYSDTPIPAAPKGARFDYKLRWSSVEGNIGRARARRPAHPAVAAALESAVSGMVPCIDSSGGETYLARADVKEALHVSGSPLKWALCSSVLRYTSEFGGSGPGASMIPIYQQLSGHYRMLVYNGDTDGCVNFMGSQSCVAAVGNSLERDWRPWHAEDAAGPQVAGYVTEYSSNLTFVTVRGAGHMVPQWKPREALLMLETFLEGKEFV